MYLDISIVVMFFALTVISGFGYGKQVKTIEQYAVGDRNFTTTALVCTLVATWVSGSSFSNILWRTYNEGLLLVVTKLFSVLSFFVMAYLIIPKMQRFLKYTSIAHGIGSIYQNKVIRMIIALSGSIMLSGFVAVQFKVIGVVMGYFTSISPLILTIIFGALVTLYSTSGGIRAVTFTDIVQFGIFSIAIPIIGIMIWNHLYSEPSFSIIEGLKHPKFDPSVVFSLKNPDLIEVIPLMLYFSFPTMRPDFAQRVLMGNNINQLKKVFLIGAFITLIFNIAAGWISFLLHSFDPNLQAKELLPYIIDHYTYAGLKGLLVTGVFAMAMSTADSSINNASVMISNDICKPLGLFKGYELFVARFVTIILGMISIVLALSDMDLLSIILKAASFYIPISSAPIILTILGFKTNPKVIISAMISSFIFVISWKYVFYIKADCNAIGMIFNALFILFVHYTFRIKGGWTEPEGYGEYKRENRRKWAKRFNAIYNFNLINYIKEISPKSESSYVSLGIYFIIFGIGNMYFTDINIMLNHEDFILINYQIILVTGVLFAAQPIWPQKLISKENKLLFSQLLWPVAIFYQMILFPSLFMLINKFSQYYIIILTINIISVPILVGWRLALFFIPAGIIASIYMCDIFLPGAMDSNYFANNPAGIIIYASILLAVNILTFIRIDQKNYQLSLAAKKQKDKALVIQEHEIKAAYAMKERLFDNFRHEFNIPIGSFINSTALLGREIDKLTKSEIKEMLCIALENHHRLMSLANNVSAIANKSYTQNDSLKKEKFSLSDLIYEVADQLSFIYQAKIEEKRLQFKFNIAENINVIADKQHISQVLDNLILNSIKFSKKDTGGVISITLDEYIDKKEKIARFTIEDNGVGFSPYESFKIFELFEEGERTKSKAEGRGIGLTLCKSVIKAHGGYIMAEPLKTGAKFVFTLPMKQ